MVFSQLRLNSPVYILHKDATPYYEVGAVQNVSAPLPQLGMMPSVGQPLNYTVDLTVRVGDQTINYQKLPANCEFADFAANGSVFVSCTRDGINTELHAMRQRSQDVLASVDYHQGVIAVCDKILQQLNPEVAQTVAQQEEINFLKSQLADMRELLKGLVKPTDKSEGTVAGPVEQ